MEFCMLLRLLLGCGFRLGEPLTAKVKDVNFSSGIILIRHAKNNKQRAIPMNETLTEMPVSYTHLDVYKRQVQAVSEYSAVPLPAP